ncbi:MAG: di-trans,poly-cis-decaprenylcistransferase [Oscillospiraceae bacterium]|nr:di-trans,poly-cis-decaprenylcistransferase [Oscillospiraceae bacterium]
MDNTVPTNETNEVRVELNGPVPQHVAIIMDGNGRWAKSRGLPRSAGHAAGAETFRTIASYCRDIGMKYLTVYAFSTENWRRPQEEVEGIMRLLDTYIHEALAVMEKERIRIEFFGNVSGLSDNLLDLIKQAREMNKKVTDGVQANICVNYGGRDEIRAAAAAFAKDCMEGRRSPEELDEALFSQYMYSKDVPDPELIIRPSGEIRTSNFLLWQSAYSEYYFTDCMWPDFTPFEINRAINDYNKRSRRFGAV